MSPTVSEAAAGLATDRSLLARAITLIESELALDSIKAQELLTQILPRTGHARRIGITGVPGVGKSTFIDALGTRLVDRGRRVAVLAVDPSSERSGGSILGDKTRMARLSHDERAFVRPSPSGGALGGVARKTREAILVCEAAGYDVVLVETVGVGQSETTVASMVDCFLVLMLPNAGDELQGIKRGILELADLIAINKADGDQLAAAERARAQYASAVAYLSPIHDGWKTEVLCVSAIGGTGLDALWDRIEAHRAILLTSGALSAMRGDQAVRWMWAAVDTGMRAALRANSAASGVAADLEREVREGRMPESAAAAKILAAFR